jgi:hypothetical protein
LEASVNEALAGFALSVYSVTLTLSQGTFAVCVLVLLPMAVLPSTRGLAGRGLFLASWLFGLTTWTLGATVTFSTYGWVGLILGMMLFGVGVVPVGIFAAFVTLKLPSLGFSLIGMSIVVYAARVGGITATTLTDGS